MQAATKAIRRATLSFCGLSFLDETERDTFENTDLGIPNGIESMEKNAGESLPAETVTPSGNMYEVDELEIKIDDKKQPYYKLTMKHCLTGKVGTVYAIKGMVQLIDDACIKQGVKVEASFANTKKGPVLTKLNVI